MYNKRPTRRIHRTIQTFNFYFMVIRMLREQSLNAPILGPVNVQLNNIHHQIPKHTLNEN